MAKHLTDEQKKKIIKDYVETENYTTTAKFNGVSVTTVKRIITQDNDTLTACKERRKQNTIDVLEHMEKDKNKVCSLIDLLLDELANEEKIKNANLRELATALGIVIDKFTKNETKELTKNNEISVHIIPATVKDVEL